MVTSSILGRNSISGRAGSGIVIRRELSTIRNRIKGFIGDRNLGGARAYLNSIRDKGAFSQTNQIINALLPQLGGNIKKSSVRRNVLRNINATFKGGFGIARTKSKAAKSNIARAAQSNIARGIKPKARVTQRTINGSIFKINAKGGFERVGFTPAEKARRERLRSGTATAKDIIPRLKVGQSQASRGATILRRLQTGQLRKAERVKLTNELKSFGPRVSKAPVKTKVKKKTFSGKSIQPATGIEKTKAFIGLTKKRQERAISRAKIEGDAFKGTAAFGAGVVLGAVRGVSNIGSAILNPVQSAVLLKDFTVALFKNPVQVITDTSAGIARQALVDPSGSLGEFLVFSKASKLLKRIPTKAQRILKNRVVEINKPIANSPTANALKNRLIRDPKTKTLYYINRKADVFRVSVTKNKINLIQSKRAVRPIHEKLGFQTKAQYQNWLRLNTKSKSATGNSLKSIENKIAKIENKIVGAKNKKVLQSEKAKLVNLSKARKARSKGLAPKQKPISKAAQKRSELARSKQLKGQKTTAMAREKGFKNAREMNNVLRQGFKNKAEFFKYGTLFKKANAGSQAATRAIVALERKLRNRKGRFVTKKLRNGVEVFFKKKTTLAQKKGVKVRKKTLKLKSKITKARKKKISKKATKTVLKELINKVKIRGKRAQSNIDSILLQIQKIRQVKTKRLSKFTLRTVKDGRLANVRLRVKFRLTLLPSVLAAISLSSRNAYSQVQDVPEILTPKYEEALLNVLRSIINQLPATLSKTTTGTKSASKSSLKQTLVQKFRAARKSGKANRQVPPPIKLIKIPELPFDPKIKNPKGFNAWIKTRKGWRKANPKPLTRANAAKIGRYVSNNSLAATHLVVGTKAKAVKRKVTLDALKRYFRPSKNKRVPKGAKVEKRTHRLNTVAERRKISAAKVIKRVNARLSRKKPKKRKVAKKKTPKRKKRK